MNFLKKLWRYTNKHKIKRDKEINEKNLTEQRIQKEKEEKVILLRSKISEKVRASFDFFTIGLNNKDLTLRYNSKKREYMLEINFENLLYTNTTAFSHIMYITIWKRAKDSHSSYNYVETFEFDCTEEELYNQKLNKIAKEVLIKETFIKVRE